MIGPSPAARRALLLRLSACFVLALPLLPRGLEVGPARVPADESAAPVDLSFLYQDWIKVVVPDLALPEERGLYQTLEGEGEKAYFREVFWARRDPSPETVENEFKIAYLQRKHRARQLFSCTRLLPGGGAENAPPAGGPPPREEEAVAGDLTDMGRVYALLGGPRGGLEETFFPESEAGSTGRPFRSSFAWVYREAPGISSPGGLILPFADEDGDGVPELRDGGRFSEETAPRLGQQSILWPEIFYLPGGRALDGRPADEVDEVELVAAVRESLRRNLPPAEQEARLHPELFFFRGEKGAVRAWLFLEIFVRRGQGSAPYRLKEDEGAANLRLRGMVVGPEGEVIESFSQRAERLAGNATEPVSSGAAGNSSPFKPPGAARYEAWGFRRVFLLQPGDYSLFLLAQDRATAKAGLRRLTFTVPDLELKQVSTSSLVLGSALTTLPLQRRPAPEEFSLGGREVDPLPPGVLAPLPDAGGPTLLYQVYLPAIAPAGAPANAEGEQPSLRTRYTFRQGSRTVLELADPPEYETRQPLGGEGRGWKVVLALPAGLLPPGEYQVEVEVLDPRSLQARLLEARLSLQPAGVAGSGAEGEGASAALACLERPPEGLMPLEAAGPDAPAHSLALTSPGPRANLFEVEQLEAQPRRGAAIRWVDFFVDGGHLLRDFQPPYRCLWRAAPQPRDHRLQAAARLADGSWAVEERRLQQPRSFLALEVDLQQIYAVVTEDPGGGFVDGLGAGDFLLAEDLEEQAISHFERQPAADTAAGFLFDLRIDPPEALQRLKEGAVSFLTGRLPPETRVFVAGYSATTTLRQELTGHRGLLAGAIRSLPSAAPAPGQGGDRLVEALCACATELEQVRAGRKILILLSDGRDVSAAVSSRTLADQLQRSGIALYAIGINTTPPLTEEQQRALTTPPSGLEKTMRVVGLGGFFRGRAHRRAMARSQFLEQRISQSLLDTLTLASGGRYFPFEVTFGAQEIARALEEVAEEQRHQVLLGYTPGRPARDSRWRTVEIGVRGRPELRVRARQGYFPRGRALPALAELESLFTAPAGD